MTCHYNPVLTSPLFLRHGKEGMEELPILLKLSRGREVMLQLRGVTVMPGVAYPQIAHQSHTLHPVIIGSDSPPIQVRTLYFCLGKCSTIQQGV